MKTEGRRKDGEDDPVAIQEPEAEIIEAEGDERDCKCGRQHVEACDQSGRASALEKIRLGVTWRVEPGRENTAAQAHQNEIDCCGTAEQGENRKQIIFGRPPPAPECPF